jgi:WSC domain
MMADDRSKLAGLLFGSFVILGTGACGSRDESTAISRAPISATFTLLVSTSASRASAKPLQGSDLTGSAYIFTSDSTGTSNPTGIAQVSYWLDNPKMTGPATHVENHTPYDFVGTASDGTAESWSTSSIANGTHTLTQSVTPASGGSATTTTATFTVGAPSSGEKLIGCYTDESTRDLPDMIASGTVTVESCVAACKGAGYTYAGVQYGTQCFCGDSYGKYGSSSGCNMKCSGNSSETCGGTWANDIYSTGAADASAPPPPPPPPSGGSGTCAPTASGPGGAGAANQAGSNIPAFPSLSSPFTVTGLDTSGGTDVGTIIQEALSSHSQIVIPGSGKFGSPYQYKVETPVNVPAGAIIECEPGAQFLDPTDCLGDMPGLFWWSNETASVSGAGMYGCMFKGTASGSSYATSYNHAFIRLQSGHNFTIEGNITTNSCGDADIRLDGPEDSSSDHGSTGNTIAFNNTNFAENGIAVINAWNNMFMCNYFNGGGIDEEPNHSYPQVGENTYTLNYTLGGISIGGNGTSCPSGSGVCARDYVTKNVLIGPGPVYCECNAAGTQCDNDSFGGTWSGNILAGGASCKCGDSCSE